MRVLNWDYNPLWSSLYTFNHWLASFMYLYMLHWHYNRKSSCIYILGQCIMYNKHDQSIHVYIPYLQMATNCKSVWTLMESHVNHASIHWDILSNYTVRCCSFAQPYIVITATVNNNILMILRHQYTMVLSPLTNTHWVVQLIELELDLWHWTQRLPSLPFKAKIDALNDLWVTASNHWWYIGW